MVILQTLAVTIAVVATVVGVGTFLTGLRGIVRTVRRGGPAHGRTDRPWTRTRTVLREVVGHTSFRNRPVVAVAHWVAMVSFVVLVLTLVSAYGQLVDPYLVLPVLGHAAWFAWVTELFAWAGLVAITVLVVVRQASHPRRREAAAGRPSAVVTTPAGRQGPSEGRSSRFFGSNHGQAYVVEATIAVVVVLVLALRGLEYALAAQDPLAWLARSGGSWAVWAPESGAAHVPFVVDVFPTTAWLGAPLVGAPTATLEAAVVVVALAKILASMAWMYVVGRRPAMGVAWHRFLAPVNMWLRREADGAPALGALPPVRAGGAGGGAPVDFADLEALPDDATLGVGRVEDFTWKGLLDLASCTECGRCQEQCPAWNTDKPLSPKLVVMALRDHAFATSPWLVPAPNASTEPGGHTSTTGHTPLPGRDTGTTGTTGTMASDPHADVDVLSLVGDVVDPQALWDCTTCGACVQQCPVDIEHVDHIVDMRRNQVLMESAFPDELGRVFRNLERQGNPWGSPARKRLAWADGLDVPVLGQDVESLADVDYLFWVGCAGAYDDRGRGTSVAVVELLTTAGVRFAVLEGEQCTGDPARRAGNELLFQELARANVELLTDAGARRIVVTCAHCFNTIAREYPQLGGRFEVVHHTELLDRLVQEGRLRPAPQEDTVTYHDPCYLGRHNEIYTPPRALLGATAPVVEMPRTGERAFCCGGGGARVWMEESGRRIGTERAAEAIGTGARTIATACPYCTAMLADGVAANGGDVEVVDAAVLLQRAVAARAADDE